MRAGRESRHLTHLSLVTFGGVTFIVYANVMEAVLWELYGGSMQVLESALSTAMQPRLSLAGPFSAVPFPLTLLSSSRNRLL
jgi:hypothetical protein